MLDSERNHQMQSSVFVMDNARNEMTETGGVYSSEITLTTITNLKILRKHSDQWWCCFKPTNSKKNTAKNSKYT